MRHKRNMNTDIDKKPLISRWLIVDTWIFLLHP